MAQSKKLNCWEFMKCGVDLYQECPAFPTGGRICYMIAGTLCGGEHQGSYAEKSKECMQCDFYLNEILNGGGAGLPGTA
jgi:hypothetical protein